jgi:hypothetical protein
MRRIVFAAMAVLIAGCGAAPVGTGTTPTPSGSPLSQVELKYRLLAQVGPIAYCDPDSYPLGRMVTAAYVAQRLASIQTTDGQTYQELLTHYKLTSTLTAAQQQTVYDDYKKLSALHLTAAGSRYVFDYSVGTGVNKQPIRTKGSIDQYGSITVDSRVAAFFTCPICLVASTQIDTPTGSVSVAQLQAGMTVWTSGPGGTRQAARVLRVASMTGGPGFLVHLGLADGRQLWVSPHHPLPDGRRVGDLVRGDQVDGSQVVLDQLLPSSAATYDLLPAGPTGTYWANGILLGSTL